MKDLQIPVLEYIPDYVKGFSESRFQKRLFASVALSSLSDKAADTSGSGILVPLGELFDVVNGVSSASLLRSDEKLSDNWIPFIRPSYRQSTSIDAFVNKQLVTQDKVFHFFRYFASS